MAEDFERTVTDEDLATFLERAQPIYDSHLNRGRPLAVHLPIRTWWTRIVDENEDGSPQSVFCFVDLRNGDVRYAASWKGPVVKASGVRGNIYAEDDEGMGVEWYGARSKR
ncbi:MAG: hypothetical protein O7F08_13615 [Deltaproteobacteria bacterium]|nr:hypothetical protein [Deltaproteobacteria bacterium]